MTDGIPGLNGNIFVLPTDMEKFVTAARKHIMDLEADKASLEKQVLMLAKANQELAPVVLAAFGWQEHRTNMAMNALFDAIDKLRKSNNGEIANSLYELLFPGKG